MPINTLAYITMGGVKCVRKFEAYTLVTLRMYLNCSIVTHVLYEPCLVIIDAVNRVLGYAPVKHRLSVLRPLIAWVYGLDH